MKNSLKSIFIFCLLFNNFVLLAQNKNVLDELADVSRTGCLINDSTVKIADKIKSLRFNDLDSYQLQNLKKFSALRIVYISAEKFDSTKLGILFTALSSTPTIYLTIDNYQFTSIPEPIGDLVNMQFLFFGPNNLISVPPELKRLKKIKILSLSSSGALNEHLNPKTFIKEIPEWICELPDLINFSCPNGRISIVPVCVCMCKKLKVLNLKGNPILSYPSCLNKPKIENNYFYLEVSDRKSKIIGYSIKKDSAQPDADYYKVRPNNHDTLKLITASFQEEEKMIIFYHGINNSLFSKQYSYFPGNALPPEMSLFQANVDSIFKYIQSKNFEDYSIDIIGLADATPFATGLRIRKPLNYTPIEGVEEKIFKIDNLNNLKPTAQWGIPLNWNTNDNKLKNLLLAYLRAYNMGKYINQSLSGQYSPKEMRIFVFEDSHFNFSLSRGVAIRIKIKKRV